MDTAENLTLVNQDTRSQQDKLKQLNDQLQIDVDNFYKQQISQDIDGGNEDKNMFNCEIEFPEEWTQVEQVEIKSGLKLDWVNQEQRNLCRQYLLCSHCQNVLWNPKKCKKCKKHSCNQCFEQIQKCPLCPEMAENKLIIKEPEELIKRQLNDLNVFCPFQKRGCRNIIEYSKFEEHVNDCKFRRDDLNVKYKQISIVSFRYKQLQALQKSHILYSIETHIKDTKKVSKVERRYKQFEILHEYFSSQDDYQGMPLPQLPPKKFCLQSHLGSSSDQITEEEIAQLRTIELETYLQIMGHYYKDDKILQEFLTNEEGFNYLNQSKQKIWSLQYLIQQYKTIKHYSSSYVEKLMNKGMVLQQNENEEQQNQIKKSERFQEQISSLNSYKVCFSELKKTLILQINNNSTQINVIEKDIEKLNEFQSESLINEFTKKCQYELKQNIIQQSQLQKTMRQIQTIHKYIESIDNCVLMFDNRVNEYEILKKTALVIQMQEKDYRDKNEWQEINKSLEMTLLESQKYHEIAEKESKKIIDRLDKELPVILKMIQECFYYTQL